MEKILILDANSLLNRAFYAIRPLTTQDGLHTNAVFGYINIVKKHLEALKPDYVAAAFDVHAPTFRHRFFAEYKGTRKPMPEELRQQLPYIRKATEALGITIAEKEGFEADDILGTLSRAAAEDGKEVYLVTGDRDSFQLVGENVTVLLAATAGDDKITPSEISARYGLTPAQLIEVKALAGDTSDNIPGVRGIGEKTAVKLIAQYGNLEAVFADVDALPLGDSAKEKLKAGQDSAFMSRTLATIDRAVPGFSSLSPYRCEGIRREQMRELLLRLEFGKMLKSFGLEEEIKSAPPTATENDFTAAQGTIFSAPAETAEPPADCDVARLSGVSPLFLCFSGENYFALSDSGAPVRLTGEIERFLRENSPVVCDYKQYLHFFHEKFGEIRGVSAALDLFLAAYVLNSQDSAVNLSRLSLIYLKKSIPTAGDDPATTLLLMQELYPVLSAALEKSEAKDLYYSIELPLAYTLAKMEICGFRIRREDLEKYGEMLTLAIGQTQAEIFEAAGEEFLIHSPKQLGRILFEKLGLPVIKKTKTGYATDADTLSKLRFQYPIIQKILDYRTFSKLNSTYVVGLQNQIAADGRIHTFFNQMLTATGRLSSAEPNLQNIPVKTELGREMRKFFTAENEDYLLADADYSQIELRLLAHISGDEALIRFFLDGKDIHTQTAAEIFHVPQDAVTPEMRKSAKAVNFGIVYGIGEFSLGQDIGVPLAVAKEYIQNYFALFPGVKRYLDEIKKSAHETGYVTTLFGRRRNIPELFATKKATVAFGERVAMNTPIQGTAADIIKLAMVRVDQRLERENLKSRLILQVHDELILECPKEEAEYAAALLSEEMEKVAQYAVPLVADAKIGFSWYDTK